MELGSNLMSKSLLTGGSPAKGRNKSMLMDEADDHSQNLDAKHVWRTDHANMVTVSTTKKYQHMF
jgi:hypothetical protein